MPVLPLRHLKAAAVALGCAAALNGCGGGDDNPLKEPFVSACAPAMARMNCGCFFDRIQDVVDEGNYRALLAFLKDKQNHPPKVQMRMLGDIVGDDNVSTIWQASVTCSR